MLAETLAALVMFTLVASITPGPNNMMLLASGANFGFVRTLPHMLGIGLGMALMLVLVGLGIMQLFERVPLAQDILKVIGTVYLLYLAYRIAVAASPDVKHSDEAKPMSVIGAMLFQWVNPKAWTMALTILSVYAPEQSLQAIMLVTLVFAIVSFPAISVWAALGTQLQKFLTNAQRLRWFNWSMAVMLVVSLYPMLR